MMVGWTRERLRAHPLRTRFGDVMALAVLGTVLALVLATTIRSPLKDDVAWLLYVARNWLAGQRLYEDLIEVNPPLIIWLYAVPAAIAGWLATPPKLIAIPMFAMLVLGSAWWCATLLRGQGPLFARRTPVFAIGIVLLALPGVEFGQREHLMSAALLPYLCLMAIWLNGQQERRLMAIAAGVAAGLGCALKPTYGLAFLLPEAICLLATRRAIRVAPIAAIGAALVYGAAVLVFCPAFLSRAVPLALALYGGTDTPLWGLVVEARTLMFGVIAATILWALSRTRLGARAGFTRSLMLILVAFSIGASVVYLLQGKNWFYHRLPAITATVLALVLWSAEMLPRLRTQALAVRRWSAAAVSTSALAAAALLAFGYADLQRMRPWIEDAVEPELSTEVRLEKIIRKEKVHSYVAFSEWIGLGFPVVNNTGVIWASRFDSMWALKGELWRARQDGRAPANWPIRHWVARDFIEGCPDLVVVDVRGGINYISVLVASDPTFAHIWTRYRQIALFNGLRVLKRDSPNCTETTSHPRMAANELDIP
jgi:hypothetical protein